MSAKFAVFPVLTIDHFSPSFKIAGISYVSSKDYFNKVETKMCYVI